MSPIYHLQNLFVYCDLLQLGQTKTQNHISIIQFSLFLRSKITFETSHKAREAACKAREPQMITAHACPLLTGQL